jgi:hypothetical protein
MQERLSNVVISFALFVVAAFWVWKHMKSGATTRATVQSAEGLRRHELPAAAALVRRPVSGRAVLAPFHPIIR